MSNRATTEDASAASVVKKKSKADLIEERLVEIKDTQKPLRAKTSVRASGRKRARLGEELCFLSTDCQEIAEKKDKKVLTRLLFTVMKEGPSIFFALFYKWWRPTRPTDIR